MPFKINATVARDAVNGTTITEDVTFQVSAYVTSQRQYVRRYHRLRQPSGGGCAMRAALYLPPTGTPNRTISMRIPCDQCGQPLTSVTVYPVVSATLDEFPFVIDSTNLGKYFDYWPSGEVKYLDYNLHGVALCHLRQQVH